MTGAGATIPEEQCEPFQIMDLEIAGLQCSSCQRKETDRYRPKSKFMHNLHILLQGCTYYISNYLPKLLYNYGTIPYPGKKMTYKQISLEWHFKQISAASTPF